MSPLTELSTPAAMEPRSLKPRVRGSIPPGPTLLPAENGRCFPGLVIDCQWSWQHRRAGVRDRAVRGHDPGRPVRDRRQIAGPAGRGADAHRGPAQRRAPCWRTVSAGVWPPGPPAQCRAVRTVSLCATGKGDQVGSTPISRTGCGREPNLVLGPKPLGAIRRLWRSAGRGTFRRWRRRPRPHSAAGACSAPAIADEGWRRGCR
jgi:hypothetical protein